MVGVLIYIIENYLLISVFFHFFCADTITNFNNNTTTTTFWIDF